MFKIARTVKQIFSAARKYSTQSKGYVEDASEEFYFESFKEILPKQSVTKDQFKAFIPNPQNIEEVRPTQLLDPAEIRKLIYARFAEEIGAGHKNDEERKNLDTKNLETKSHAAREHEETFTTYNIADEFNDLSNQGYDFASARKAIENQNVRSLSDRMKGLVVAGYISNYGGESGLKEEVEKLMHKQGLVIEEFMQRLAGELGVHSSELLG